MRTDDARKAKNKGGVADGVRRGSDTRVSRKLTERGGGDKKGKVKTRDRRGA